MGKSRYSYLYGKYKINSVFCTQNYKPTLCISVLELIIFLDKNISKNSDILFLNL